MKSLLVTSLIVSLTIPAQAAKSTHEEEITAYLQDFLRVYPKRLAQALSYVPIVVEASFYEQVDPLLVATVISFESSWQHGVIGRKGEKGLMQVHGLAAKGFDLTTIRGQVRAGVAHLGECWDKCGGDIAETLGCYSTKGACNGNYWFAKRRYEEYCRNVEKYRGTKP
jgi:soluble lytic murein transglycosylase-like protein